MRRVPWCVFDCAIRARSEVVESKSLCLCELWPTQPSITSSLESGNLRWLASDFGLAECGAAILLKCFKTCSLFNPVCCAEENKAFWHCYKSKRVCHLTKCSLLLMPQACACDSPHSSQFRHAQKEWISWSCKEDYQQ